MSEYAAVSPVSIAAMASTAANNSDLVGALSSSHKRSCNLESHVPEAKRQQLSSFFDTEFPALKGDEKPDKTAAIHSSNQSSADFSKGDFELPFALETDEDQTTNIADTSDYIESLLNIIQMGDDNQSIRSASSERYSPNTRALPFEGGVVFPITNVDVYKGVGTDEVQEEDDRADDTLLLNTLPTSVDDFQTKEFHLKLERNISSPLVSRRQSPSLLECGRTFSEASDCSSLVASRTHSVSSNVPPLDDLDADDLEVAMINESFEEQQKQSMIYDCINLKSLFYGGMSKEKQLQQNDNSVCGNEDASEVFNGEPSYGYAKETEILRTDKYTIDTDQSDSADNLTPPIDIGGNKFVPLLTPKSKQFVLRKKPNHYLPSSKPLSISNSATGRVLPEEEEDDDEKSRRLDMELEKMMLEEEEVVIEEAEEDDIYPKTLTEADLLRKKSNSNSIASSSLIKPSSACSLLPYTSKTVASNEESMDAAKEVAYGVVASLFSSPMPESSMPPEEGDTTEDRYTSDNSTPDPPDDPEQNPMEESRLLSESFLREIDAEEELLAFGEGVPRECDLLDVSGGKGGLPLALDSRRSSALSSEGKCISGHSSSSAVCSLAGDEQKVPVLDSWEDLEDADMSEKMINEVKLTMSKVKVEKTELLLGESPSTSFSSSSALDGTIESLSNVLEVEMSGNSKLKSEADVAETIQMFGLGSFSSLKKVDDRRFLLAFPSTSNASEALLSKRSTTLFKLRPLNEAPKQSQLKAKQWKTLLEPKAPKPQRCAAVARRMIENSLSVRVKVSEETREKEARQLAYAREQKRRKNDIWAD